MLTPFILLTLLSISICHPIEDEVAQALVTDNNGSSLHVVHLQKDLNIVSYIQNFKNIMAQYVSSQYKDLTVRELDEVRNVLEEFLKNFAKDLREVVDNKDEVKWKDEEAVDDGMPDYTFDEIKTAIRTEFPDISEETSKEIVYRLRKNLFVTREKLDGIIFSSHNAQIAHSLE